MHEISPDTLSLDKVGDLLRNEEELYLSEDSANRIRRCRNYLEDKILNSKEPLYGINTGFGSLCNVEIDPAELEQLQENLVKSHACGMGEEVPAEIVRLMLLLKIHSLSLGYSAVQLSTVEMLINFYNKDILPVIYQQGSLGASGDLAPLAHLSLPLIGLGEVRWKGKLMPSDTALNENKLKPIRLQSKEGLAMLNGTQFCSAYSVYNVLEAKRLLRLSSLCAALSLDAFHCHLTPFDERLHLLRPYDGQRKVANEVLEILSGSEISQQLKSTVQDPYAFRCVPQVHGASAEAIAYVEKIILTEINSVTDNPTVLPEEDVVLSGGNFHAQPLALAMDILAIALSELGSISERRTYQLISGQRGLPPVLSPHSGLNSGLMIPHYTAAGIVSQNKQLSTPASVDSIVSSNGQEDHVSMGANAATKAFRVVKNLVTLLAIEFMTGAQAIEFRRPLKTSERLEELLKAYRLEIPKLDSDRILHPDIVRTVEFLDNTTI
jgi:histidine ammonia-lyase